MEKKIAEEKIQKLAIELGPRGGVGYYDREDCVTRPAFSSEDTLNVMLLLSKGYVQVNFEVSFPSQPVFA